jgi:4-hydroxy-tetrahydrodipicolinate synthase
MTGAYAAVTTPLHADGTLDEAALRAVVRHPLDGGLDGVLVLGSTGEVATLAEPIRRRVVEIAVGEAGSRVMAGVTGTGVADTAAMAGAWLAAGCDRVVVTPSLYGPSDARRTAAFYRAVVDRLGTPVVAYHIPALTGGPVMAPVVADLAAAGVLTGVKDSARDLEYHQSVLTVAAAVPGFDVFQGSDTLLLPSAVLGGSGSISAGAGLVPRLVRDLYAAVSAGRLDLARQRQRRLTEFTTIVRTGCFPAGFKYAAELLGIGRRTPAAPTPPLTTAESEALAAALERFLKEDTHG